MLKIIRNDITHMNTDAIVNTANTNPIVGPGCDFAIYTAAGYDELLTYRREHIGIVPEGDVFLTPGFGLAAKYIIHAVSPRYEDGTHGEEDKLRSCYRKALSLASVQKCSSIAIPLVASGSFGYPKADAIRIAVDEINSFLLDNDMDVYLVVWDEVSTKLGTKLYPDLEEFINQNYVDENTIFECKAFREEIRQYDACDYLAIDVSALDERVEHMSDTFSEYLLYLIELKGMTNSEVWRNALVDKKVFSKIKNNPYYHPNKLTAMCLCVGAKLNIDETTDLLARAGYALSPCSKTDIIFRYFIEKGWYDMLEIDIQLEEHGEDCIIK